MSQKKNNSTEMTFWDHILELRRRIITFIIFLLLCSIAGYNIFPFLIKALITVLKDNLYMNVITEGFLMRIKISIIIGLILSIPVLLYEILAFIFPALTKKEKIIILSAILTSSILFLFGVVFSYKYVLPFSITFLTSNEFVPENVKKMISYQTFITFFLQFLFAFGLCFQFPIILILLLKLKIIKYSFLIKNTRFVIVIIFIAAAVLTPGPDVQSQILLAIPLFLLYILTLIFAKIFKLGV